MSILVGNIRLPLGAADAEALEAAAKKCGLSMRELCGAHIYRASIDARRGKITRVLSVLLDLAPMVCSPSDNSLDDSSATA